MNSRELNDNELHESPLLHDCESAYQLISQGKRKQAEQLFPLEAYLIKKYLSTDLKELSTLLENRLTLSI
jgi:hypothetical protein